MLNPKAAVFFVTFPPQFLPAGEPAFPRSLALMANFALWLCALVAGVDRPAWWLRRARVQAWLEGITGACLLARGARLALARH